MSHSISIDSLKPQKWARFFALLILTYGTLACLYCFDFPNYVIEPLIFFLFIIFISGCYFHYPQLFCWQEWRFDLKSMFITLITSFLICLFILTYKHFHCFYDETLFDGRLYQLHPTQLSKQVIFLLAYVISCPFQECFARGMIQKAFTAMLPKRSATLSILFASVLFACLHIYIGHLMVIFSFMLGLYWGILYYLYRNLLALTFSHLIIGIWALYVVGLDKLL